MNYKFILSSSSPRRKQLLSLICPRFETKVISVEEILDKKTPVLEVAKEIAILKAKPWYDIIKEDEIVITADTIVSLDDEIFGKPKSKIDAKKMLKKLSAQQHTVSTGVAITHKGKTTSFCDISYVTFSSLSNNAIDMYISTNSPYDKAGGYGIQDDFGLVFIEKIVGSYSSIMGLPLALLRGKLADFINFQSS